MASQEFVRSVNHEMSRNARSSVQACNGKAHTRKRDHSPWRVYRPAETTPKAYLLKKTDGFKQAEPLEAASHYTSPRHHHRKAYSSANCANSLHRDRAVIWAAGDFAPPPAGSPRSGGPSNEHFWSAQAAELPAGEAESVLPEAGSRKPPAAGTMVGSPCGSPGNDPA